MSVNVVMSFVTCALLARFVHGYHSSQRIVCSRIPNDSKAPLKVWIRRHYEQFYNPQVEYKRPSFHPWAGKRSINNEIDHHPKNIPWDSRQFTDNTGNTDEDSKRAFSAWGGKRDNIEPEIKRGFHAWGGKRNSNENLPEIEKNNFHAWIDKHTSEADPPAKKGFHAWGGKRNKGFHAWGGKRQEATSNASVDVPLQTVFNAWGGKREGTLNEMSSFKRAFNPWGGKRGGPSADLKRVFGAWGGKRQKEMLDGKRSDNSDTWSENQQSENSNKRGFHAWGGKRRIEALDKFNDLGHFQTWNNDNSPVTDDSGTEKSSSYEQTNPGTHEERENIELKTREFNAWGGR